MQGEEKRIYVVVANTVQHPLFEGRRGEDTRTIVQVPGRQIAQACHAVRRMGHYMVIRAVLGLFEDIRGGKFRNLKNRLDTIRATIAHELHYEPITTIVLSCRDSFELEHVYDLLRIAGVDVFMFFDTNPAVYGEGEVRTAFATDPIDPSKTVGVIDYLPLWSPEVTGNKG